MNVLSFFLLRRLERLTVRMVGGDGKEDRHHWTDVFLGIFRWAHVNKVILVSVFACFIVWLQVGQTSSLDESVPERVSAPMITYGKRCTPERLHRLVKLRVSNRDHCPHKDDWWLPFCTNFSSALSRPLVHVNIGCNKGFDFLANLEDLSGNETYSPVAYYDRLAQLGLGFDDDGACKQGSRKNLVSRTKPNVSTPRQVEGFCFEPLPATLVSLKAGMKSLGPNVVVAPYALSSYHGEAFFTKRASGKEGGGITTNAKGHRVLVTTLDRFAEEMDLDVIDLLSIDTEGNDMRVLYGSVNFLTTRLVRVIEFEVHEKGQWYHTRVDNLIDLVDNLGFDCYWAAGKKKPLLRMTGCTHKAYEDNELKHWSNVVCVNRVETKLAELFERTSLRTENDPDL